MHGDEYASPKYEFRTSAHACALSLPDNDVFTRSSLQTPLKQRRENPSIHNVIKLFSSSLTHRSTPYCTPGADPTISSTWRRRDVRKEKRRRRRSAPDWCYGGSIGLRERAWRSILRKEVIQPQVPLRLPCYDFTPVADPTVVDCPLAVSASPSGKTNSHGVTGGVYKARERIHRGMLIRDY